MGRTKTLPRGDLVHLTGSSPGGFTLVELLVVLVIMALVTSLAVPRFQAAMPGLQLSRAIADVRDAARKARAAAITNNKSVLLTFDLETGRFGIAGEHRPKQLADGVHLQLTAARSETSGPVRGGVRFFPDGTSTGGRLILTAGSVKREMLIDWFNGRASEIGNNAEN